ncbi:MAG: transglutaminase domain-containing protein, partial [Promethearchaeia archaeon]
MSLERELLKPQLNKKRVAAVILIAVILIAFFSLSTVLFSFLFGSQRKSPNEKLDDADFDDVSLIMPDLPFDLQDLIDAMDLDPQDLEELGITEEDIAELLQEMYDGDIDEMDLSMMAATMAALLGSEEEVFRIFDYNAINNLSNKLWRYECFEEYDGANWKSSASKQIFDFYSYGDLDGSEDVLKLKNPMSPSSGENSFVAPNLFPNPNIMEGSVNGDTLDESSVTLYKDDYNCTTMDATFNSDQDTNMTYELFGVPQANPDYLNTSQVDESYTPSAISDLYLQLPPSIDTYRNNHENFARHCDNLEMIIKDSDGAFTVANKIRNYLQVNFTDPYNGGADMYINEGPAEGEDEIEWFCEKEGGLWTHFASAFTAFTRVFGVSSRFVDGFNSRQLDEVYDNQEGKDCGVIRYKNLYNWAEIYVPTDTSGNGTWVEMDVNFESYGGGAPTSEHQYNITLSSNFSAGNRGNIAELNASLSSDTGDLEGVEVEFLDQKTETSIGTAFSDTNGDAILQVDIDDSEIVGPHNIYAACSGGVSNPITYLVYGDIEVHLESVTPQEVNRSDATADETTIKGYVFDPIKDERVPNADIEYVLLEKGTNNRYDGAFNPSSSQTNTTGEFEDTVDVNPPPTTPYGTFDIRVDFNGTWDEGLYDASGIMENSSNRIEFNHTSSYNVNFYINETISTNYENPKINRNDTLKLKARVVAVDGSPLSGKDVQFINSDNGTTLDTNTTNAEGIATYTYKTGNHTLAGPNLLCAQVGYVTNYSYFVLEETPTIRINSGPTPREINRTGSGETQFSVNGSITDRFGNPVPHAELYLKIFQNTNDRSSHLIPQQSPRVESDGTFNFSYGVEDNIPYGNYSLRMDFNGTVDRYSDPNSPNFTISGISNSTYLKNELKIEAPDVFKMNFFINGTPNDQFESPRVGRNAELNLSVKIQWGIDLAENGDNVTFYDITQDKEIGRASLADGYTEFTYLIDNDIIAGPHKIFASFDRHGEIEKNCSYFILDDPIEIDLDTGPNPRVINSTGSTGRTFMIHGYLNDSLNEKPIKYGKVSVHMFDGSDEVSFYLNQEGGSLELNETGEIYAKFSVDPSTPQKNYTIQVQFNGTFLYSNSPESNKHDYFLDTWNNFSTVIESDHDLKIKNPDNVSIIFKINGTHTRPTYDNTNPPQTYKRGENATFEVWVNQSKEYAPEGSTVRLLDNYTNTELEQYVFEDDDKGYHQFTINTSESDLHAGLHHIIVTFENPDSDPLSTFNFTYIVINESVNIFSSVSEEKIIRNQNGLIVDGLLSEWGKPLRGLGIKIKIYNSSWGNASSYFYLEGPASRIIQDNGSYKYNITHADIDCPQGKYFIEVNFTGDILTPNVNLNDYMEYN